jgi:hypothetical protein
MNNLDTDCRYYAGGELVRVDRCNAVLRKTVDDKNLISLIRLPVLFENGVTGYSKLVYDQII